MKKYDSPEVKITVVDKNDVISTSAIVLPGAPLSANDSRNENENTK